MIAHPHHSKAFDLVESARNGLDQAHWSTLGLAEFYSVLTRTPFSPRIQPSEASRIIEDDMLPFFNLVEVDAADYRAIVRECAAAGLVGGVVHDMIHLRCAQKAECDQIWTFNVKDFQRLAAVTHFRGRVVSP